MKFLDLFTRIEKGNVGLTEEAVYKSIQLGNTRIPLWGGNQQHASEDRFVDELAKTKYGDRITVFAGTGIIISLDGSAGCMTYKTGTERFSLNHHAGFFRLRDDARDKIDPEFFSVFCQKQLQEAAVSEGSKTLSLEQIYEMEFAFPPLPIQLEIMARTSKLRQLRDGLNAMLEKMQSLTGKTIHHV